MHATLKSLLNSWTGFRKASLFSGSKMCDVFSVWSLKPGGTSIVAVEVALLVAIADACLLMVQNANMWRVASRQASFKLRRDSGMTLCLSRN
jgi:hypothetical protein